VDIYYISLWIEIGVRVRSRSDQIRYHHHHLPIPIPLPVRVRVMYVNHFIRTKNSIPLVKKLPPSTTLISLSIASLPLPHRTPTSAIWSNSITSGPPRLLRHPPRPATPSSAQVNTLKRVGQIQSCSPRGRCRDLFWRFWRLGFLVLRSRGLPCHYP
jgi:hypothetical protein